MREIGYYEFISILLSFISCIISLYSLIDFLVRMPGADISGPFATYDNIAGVVATICPIAPYLLHGVFQKKKNIAIVFLGIYLASFVTVFLLRSRIGIIGITVPTVLYIYMDYAKKNKKKYKQVLPFIIVVVVLYFAKLMIWKTDSAEGRILIWTITINMIRNSPFWGYGIGGFHKNYMNFQAQYFQSNINSLYSSLADNVSTPFCDYLLLITNWGIFGVLFFLAIYAILALLYKKSKSEKKNVCLCSIVSILILSLTSYPFLYPITWVILFINIFLICNSKKLFVYKIGSKVRIITFITLVIIQTLLVRHSYYLYMWSSDSDFYKELKLEKYFSDNPYFQYNCAMIDFEKGHYDKTISRLLKCSDYWADYDVNLYIGLSYILMENYSKAIYYIDKAHYMCPNRFLPPYYKAFIYKQTGNILGFSKQCDEITHMPIKIHSWEVMNIKYRAKLHNSELFNIDIFP